MAKEGRKRRLIASWGLQDFKDFAQSSKPDILPLTPFDGCIPVQSVQVRYQYRVGSSAVTNGNKAPISIPSTPSISSPSSTLCAYWVVLCSRTLRDVQAKLREHVHPKPPPPSATSARQREHPSTKALCLAYVEHARCWLVHSVDSAPNATQNHVNARPQPTHRQPMHPTYPTSTNENIPPHSRTRIPQRGIPKTGYFAHPTRAVRSPLSGC